MAHQYPSVGTTARSEPVSNTNLLFPNGYDRNENIPNRPLVKVLDIADIDDKYNEDDYAFDTDGSPTENVTVTIKLCPDGVVTKTEARHKNNRHDKNEQSVDSRTERAHDSGPGDEGGIFEGASGIALVASGVAANFNMEDVNTNTEDVQEVHEQTNTFISQNRELIYPRKDTLYEEYERFVARSPPADISADITIGEINVSSNHTNTKKQNSVSDEVIDLTKNEGTHSNNIGKNSELVAKPKVKVVKPVVLKSFQNESISHLRSTPERSQSANERTQAMDRTNLFSPRTKTPIVIEVSPSDTDEGQDFMTYLQELKKPTADFQTEPNSEAIKPDTAHAPQGVDKRKRQQQNTDRKITRRNSDISNKDQSVTSKGKRRSSVDVIIISDDDENETANSLLDFNFCTLRKKSNQGGNGFHEENDSQHNCTGDIKCPKIPNAGIGCGGDEVDDTNETSDEESEEEDKEDGSADISKKHTDDDDGDKDDDNEKGNGSSGSNGNVDDLSDDQRNDTDDDPYYTDEGGESDDQYQGEGHFSPGMRSRTSIGIETVSDFDSAEEIEQTKTLLLKSLKKTSVLNVLSAEDEEVREILDISDKQDKIDCRFETIESRKMNVDLKSNTNETSDSDIISPEGEIINDVDVFEYNVGFRKVSPRPLKRTRLPSYSINGKHCCKSAGDNCLHGPFEEDPKYEVTSESSSYLETDSGSDFENVFEEGDWTNTMFSDIEDDTYSENNTDYTDSDSFGDAEPQISVKPIQGVSDDEYESATENEQDIMESKYCNDRAEKCAVNSEYTVEDSHCSNQHTRRSRATTRTISYNTPFFKQEQTQETELRWPKKFKLVCKLRQDALKSVMPWKEDSRTENTENKETNSCYIENEIDWNKCERHAFDTNENSKQDNNKRWRIKVIGQGFYIFGAGDGLVVLPFGPKLRRQSRDVDTDTDRRSVYFRGVPGIINNAHKMSTYMFPKLALPRDSASRKILHACNRLATQLSPLSARPPDTSYGMMLEDKNCEESDGSDSTLSLGLHELLMSAKDLLNCSRFEDAEITFLKLYKEIQEKPEDSSCLLVETLSGFADICIRRSRMCRSNPLEWQWLCMHAIALLQYTIEFCESELENQLDNQEMEWFTEQKQLAENKCRPLEDAFLRALYNCLKHDAGAFDPFQSFSLPNTPVSQNRITRLFPLSSTMPQYLVVPGMRYRITDKGLTKQSADDSEVVVDWLAKFQHYCKDRLQSNDHKGVTEKILKATGSKNEDDTESVLSNGSHDSLDWDHSDLQGIDEISVEPDEESPVSDYSFEYELVCGDSENEGWDFFLHQRRNCNFESVVQVAANFEKCDENDKESRKLDKETSDIYQHEKTEKHEKVKRKHSEPRDIVSPLHEHSISLTLARSFCRLADKLVHEEEYKKAEAVYEKILDIIDTIQDGTAGMLRFSARIMKNLGTVKSKQGKSSSGLVLLNKALNTYRDLQDEEANFEIAVALIELGNGYIVGKNHEDSVFDDVIIAICDFFEKDASDSHSASTSSSGSASQISQMTSSLGSNSEERNVEEAVMCYTEAIALLDHFEADDKQIDMFAKAVMRLGDCYFMQKDYDKALECYERALGMFKTNNIFGKDSLMENAHVLCMLGVSSFMLHVYPRAASVFEMALHMVRCAYGFKRTFMNGMLQSLSGITYYKMKNYHKCVSMCYQGYETYCEIFGEGMSRLDKQKFWLVCQTLYVMGNSYNILNLQQKAMKYLKIARSLMKSCKSRERRQFMRVLQILGDAYFAQYDYKTALQFYNEALEYGECESQVSFDEVFDPNCASDEMTIHNHLVSKSAEAHLSMQQYQNAVHYLEQAHDMQEVMGEDIKEDLINTLNQLGHMHSMAGDVNKAIESYKECLEVFSEIHKGKLGPEMCTTLGNLGAMCYVNACISGTQEEEHQMLQSAETYFQDAIKLDRNAEVCVRYGNFLHNQCNFTSAITYLIEALHVDHVTSDIVYGGLEKVTLPELLQDEVDTQEEICLPSSCLARYLLILCHKALHEMDIAEAHLIGLMEEVTDYGIPLLHSLLGYAMMELMLFEEAAGCFLTAAESEEDYQLAYENYCICLLVIVMRALRSGIENILEYYRHFSRGSHMQQYGIETRPAAI